MSKTVSLVLLVSLQVIYFSAYKYWPLAETMFFLLWLPVWACNYYLLYNLFPLWKNYVKSKKKFYRVLYYVILFLVSALLTNAPSELIIEGEL